LHTWSLVSDARQVARYVALCLVAAGALPLLFFDGCNCQTPPVGNWTYPCVADSDCASGYECSPASKTCVSAIGDSGSPSPDGAAADAATVDAGKTDSGTDSGIVAADSGTHPGVDAGADAGSDAGTVVRADAGPDAGPDAGGDAGCAVYTSTVDPNINGGGSAVNWTGAPRFLYEDPNQNQIYYVECESGCSGPSPVYSSPLNLSQGNSDPPSLIVMDTSQIAGLWLGSSGATYAECSGGCSALSGWSLVALTPPPNLDWTATDNGLAELGGIHAAALLAADNTPDAGVPLWASYAECVAGCSMASNWTSVALAPSDIGGRGLAISDMVGGVTLRTIVFAPAGPMLYGECTSDCTQVSSWSLAYLDIANQAKVVIDHAGLPRIIYETSNGMGGNALYTTRCSQRPCTTVSNWSATQLLPTVSSQSVGVDPNGLTWFVADDGTNLWLGIETPSLYTVSMVTACGTAFDGANPAGYLGPQDQYRLLYNQSGNGMMFSYQTP
jgi:hypothetical protein